MLWKKRIGSNASMTPSGRDTFEYHEGARRLEVLAEMLVGQPERVLYTSSIKAWLPPHQHEALTEADRERILDNVKTCFTQNGITFDIQ